MFRGIALMVLGCYVSFYNRLLFKDIAFKRVLELLRMPAAK